MYNLWMLRALFLPITLPSLCAAHGGHNNHGEQPLQEQADWATRHMAEEHHISNFDAPSFFTLHDYNSDGYWDSIEILRTYGFEDESTRDVPQETRMKVPTEVIQLFDYNGDGRIDNREWVMGWKSGVRLPDFGTGRGIHYSYEVEYELNHFEHFHDEDTREEDLMHPEDIEHFRRHELEDAAADRQAQLDSMSIVEENIPAKFRRVPS